VILLYYTGDTYTEIENGVAVDYYCINGDKYNTHKSPLFTGPSCLYSTSDQFVVNATTNANLGNNCFSTKYGNYIVCDPIP